MLNLTGPPQRQPLIAPDLLDDLERELEAGRSKVHWTVVPKLFWCCALAG